MSGQVLMLDRLGMFNNTITTPPPFELPKIPANSGRVVLWTIGTASTILLTVKIISKRKKIKRAISDTATKMAATVRTNLPDRLVSFITNTFSSRVKTDFRSVFRRVYPTLKPNDHMDPTHTHAESAAIRTVANNFITTSCLMAGREPYAISSSKTEEKKDFSRSRYHYFAKDLQYQHHHSKSNDNHAITMTDVDYYVDMPAHLNGKLVLVSTFNPIAVCGTTHNASYTINEDDELVMYVNGGGRYSHELWDYETDHLMVDHWWGSSMYLLERYNFSADRTVVAFVPIRDVYGPLGWLIPGRRLTRRRFAVNGFAHSRFHKSLTGGQIQVRHSIGRLGQYGNVSISNVLLQAIITRMSVAKQPNISDVERLLRTADDPDIKDVPYAATLLFEFFKANPNFISNTTPMTSFDDSRIDGYQTLRPLATEDGKPTTRRVMPALCDDGYFPVRSYNNDMACINGRVKNVKNLTPTHKVPARYWAYMTEYVNHLVGSYRGKLHPLDHDEMMEHVALHGPKGVDRAERVEHDLFDDGAFVSSFQKSESYGKITDPRNISTLPTKHNFRLGQFVYPFSQHIMKEQPWYAFGTHPSNIGDRLMAVAYNTAELVPSDISKNDGSVPYVCTALDTAVYSAAYAKEYVQEIITLIQAEAKTRGITAQGVQYEVDFQTNSGSSMTSDRNTRLNSYVSYCAARDSGLNPIEAYNNLGIYGGDDGVNRNITEKMLRQAFANIGMCCTTEAITATRPVSFLGRIFLDPWNTAESIFDVRRAITKFHLVNAPLIVPNDLLLVRKAAGFLATDPNTPLLSDLCHAVIRANTPLSKAAVKYSSCAEADAYLKKNVPYYAKYTSPFPSLVSLDLVRSVVCDSMQCDPPLLDSICEKLAKVKTMDDFLEVENVFHKEEKVDVTAAHRGEIKDGTKNPTPNSKDSKHQQTVAANKPTAPNLSKIMREVLETTRQPKLDTSKPKLPLKSILKKTVDTKTNLISIMRDVLTSTPQKSDKTPVENKFEHDHTCVSCGCVYLHIHVVDPKNHPIFAFSCPNKKCKEYYGLGNTFEKGNPSKSRIVHVPFKAKKYPELFKIMSEVRDIKPAPVETVSYQNGAVTVIPGLDDITLLETIVEEIEEDEQGEIKSPEVQFQQRRMDKYGEPVFERESDADDYYGFDGHQNQCRRCFRWSRFIDEGRCDNYPWCIKKGSKPITTTTIIQNGDKAENRRELKAPVVTTDAEEKLAEETKVSSDVSLPPKQQTGDSEPDHKGTELPAVSDDGDWITVEPKRRKPKGKTDRGKSGK